MSSFIIVHPSGMDPFLSRLPAYFHDSRECWGDDRDLAVIFSSKSEAEKKAEENKKRFGDGCVVVDLVERPEIEAALSKCFLGNMEALPIVDQYYRQYGIVSVKYFAGRALFGAPGSRRMLSGSFNEIYRGWAKAATT